MRIILIGPPGSGKGTQGFFITQRYNIPCISTGDMLRNVINEKSNFSKIIKNTIDSGYLVPDPLVISLLKERLKSNDCKRGFLLDGFPRTVTQAYAMKVMNIKINIILVFSISKKSIIKRILERYVHLPSGRVYHPKFNPPKQKGYDDITGEALTFRKDDNEKIFRKRLIEYHRYTIPVIDFYHKESIMNNNIRYFVINCNYGIFEIQRKLMKILD